MLSDGQPDKRMQEWSPVQVSGSMPKRSRTTRLPSLMALRTSGFSRRWRFSMHSDCAMMTLGPGALVVSASLSMARMLATSKVWVVWRTHVTPTPRTADSMAWKVLRVRLSARDDKMSCPPVAAV